MLPRLTTERLVLDPFTEQDIDVLYSLWIDPDVRKYLWDDVVIPRETAEEVVLGSIASATESGIGFWTLRQPEQSDVIGFCGLRPIDESREIELLYGLKPDHWNKGLAAEASRAALAHGFSLGLQVIHGRTDVPNERSARVLQRLGMEFVGESLVNGLPTLCFAIQNK